jgi:hypothetical protein
MQGGGEIPECILQCQDLFFPGQHLSADGCMTKGRVGLLRGRQCGGDALQDRFNKISRLHDNCFGSVKVVK